MYETSLTHTPESINQQRTRSFSKQCARGLHSGFRGSEGWSPRGGSIIPLTRWAVTKMQVSSILRLTKRAFGDCPPAFGILALPSAHPLTSGLGYAPCPHPLPSGGSRRSVSKHLEHFTLSIGRLRTRYNRGLADVKELSCPYALQGRII